jgi:hypothetical protein
MKEVKKKNVETSFFPLFAFSFTRLRERERERRFIINASEQRGFLPPHSKYTKIELAFFSLLCEKKKNKLYSRRRAATAEWEKRIFNEGMSSSATASLNA